MFSNTDAVEITYIHEELFLSKFFHIIHCDEKTIFFPNSFHIFILYIVMKRICVRSTTFVIHDVDVSLPD